MSKRISKRCKHRNTVRRVWSDIAATIRRGNGWIDATESAPGPFDAIVCNDCHEWLPLGHSDETPERVAVEIRAAELASDERHMLRLVSTGVPGEDDEVDGYLMMSSGRAPQNASQLAGYLARVIADHKETP